MVTGPCSEEPLEEPGSFRERLSLLEAAIPYAATEAQPLLRHIYRSTRRLHDQLQRIDPTPPLPRSVVSEVRCFDCGRSNTDSFHTSKQGGYDLCPSCFQQRLRTGRARTAH